MKLAAFSSLILCTSCACTGTDAPASDATPSATASLIASAEVPKSPRTSPPPAGPTRYPATAELSPITLGVAETLRSIAARNPNRNDAAFIKVGDSHVISGNFLHCFAKTPPPPELAKSVDVFRSSFTRESLATLSGKTASWPLEGHPTPLDQELGAMNPRFAFVSFGSNDMEAGRTYATALRSFHRNMNQLLERLVSAGVVPILSGLPPRGQRRAQPWTPVYDTLLRGMAESMQIPYFSVYVANQALPRRGLVSDGLHENVFVKGVRDPCNFSAEALTRGYNLRNLRSMQQLDLVKRIVVDGFLPSELPPSPIRGVGTRADPVVIDGLPFTHHGTNVAEQLVDHPGCTLAKNGFGQTTSYRLTLERETPVRIFLFEAESTRLNIHIQDQKNACSERSMHRVLPAGAHTITVEGATTSYLLIAVRCEPGDDECQER